MLERQQMTPEEKRRRASEKTILIVEDELPIRRFLRAAIRNHLVR